MSAAPAEPRRIRLRHLAVAALAALVLALAPAARAQSSAQVRLIGIIPPHASVQFGTSNPAVVSITLNNSRSEIPLFNLTDSNNGGEGYTISVQALNVTAAGQPQLVAQEGNGAPVPFQLNYNGQPLLFENGTATLKTIGGQKMGDGSGALGLVPLGQGNGAYTTTLQFVIRGN